MIQILFHCLFQPEPQRSLFRTFFAGTVSTVQQSHQDSRAMNASQTFEGVSTGTRYCHLSSGVSRLLSDRSPVAYLDDGKLSAGQNLLQANKEWATQARDSAGFSKLGQVKMPLKVDGFGSVILIYLAVVPGHWL